MNIEITKKLQYLVTNLSQNSMTHRIQARVFDSLGFSKLCKKYKEHADEEMSFVEKFIDRLLDLGYEIKNEKKEEQTIYKDPVECIKYDLKISKEGLSWLREFVEEAKSDLITYDILKDYYIDEEKDMYWYENQLEIIEKIGLQNYLTTQI